MTERLGRVNWKRMGGKRSWYITRYQDWTRSSGIKSWGLLFFPNVPNYMTRLAGTLNYYTLYLSISRPCHSQTDTGFSQRRPGFNPGWASAIRGGRSGTGAGFSPSSKVFPYYPSFHHCSILIYHHPTRCAIVLTKQHIIIPSALSYGLHLWPGTWLVSE
jgi:hypothetical protein